MYKYCLRNIMERQTRRHYLRSEERAYIIALYKAENPRGKMVTQIGCSKNTLSKWIKIYESTNNVERKKSGKTFKKTTEENN